MYLENFWCFKNVHVYIDNLVKVLCFINDA